MLCVMTKIKKNLKSLQPDVLRRSIK